MTVARLAILSILACGLAGGALADPPAATIPMPAATIPMPAATIPAPATPAPAAKPQKLAKAAANPADKVICKTEMPIGSRLGGRRVCMTKLQWEAQSQAAQSSMENRLGAGANSH